MDRLPPWEEIKQSPFYNGLSPVQQNQMRDEWFNEAANRDNLSADQRKIAYKNFISSTMKESADNNIRKAVAPVPESGFDEEYSGITGAVRHAIGYDNWAVQGAIKLDNWLEEKFGIEPGGITKTSRAMKREGWEYKPKTTTESMVHDIATLTPDLALLSVTNPVVSKGIGRVISKAAPSLLNTERGIKVARGLTTVLGGSGGMGVVGAVGGAIGDEGTPGEGFGHGAKLGAAGSAASLIADSVVSLAEKRFPLARLARHPLDIALGSVAMGGVSGDLSPESLAYNAVQDIALKATRLPGHLIEKKVNAKRDYKVLMRAAENLPDFERAHVSSVIEGMDTADKTVREKYEMALGAFADSYAKTTPFSKELVVDHLDKAADESWKDYENEISKYRKSSPEEQKRIRDELYAKKSKQIFENIDSIKTIDDGREVSFFQVVNKVVRDQFSPQQLKHLGKAEMYHAIKNAFEKSTTTILPNVETKKDIMSQLKPRNKQEEAGINALRDNIGFLELQLTNYDRYIDHIKADPEYKRKDFDFDWGKFKREDLEKKQGDNEFAQNMGDVHAVRKFVMDNLVHSLHDVVGDSCKSGKEFVDLVDKAVLEWDQLSGSWQRHIDPIKHLSERHNDALRKYLQNREFGEYVKKNKFSDEEISAIKAIGENLKQVHEDIASRSELEGVKGFERLPDYFPIVFQEKTYKDPKVMKEMIDRIANDADFLDRHVDNGKAHYENVEGVRVVKKGDKILRVVEITDPVTQTKRFDEHEYQINERREAARKFLMDYKNTRERRYGHLQLHQVFKDAPDEYLEKNVYGVLSEYYQRSAKRLMEIKHFGDRDQVLKEIIERANTELAEDKEVSTDEHLHRMMMIKHAYDAVTYEHPHVSPFTEQMISAWLGFNTLRKMLLSPIGQTGQFFSGIVRAGSTSHWGKTLRMRMTGGKDSYYNPETGKMEQRSIMDIAHECGSTNSMIMNDFMRTMTGDVKTAIHSGVAKMLDWNQFKKIDSANRIQAAGTGWFYAKDMTARINKILGTNFAKSLDLTTDQGIDTAMSLLEKKKIFGGGVKDRFAKRRFEQLGLDLREVIKRGRSEDGKFYLTKAELLKAAREFEIQTNFRATKMDLPLQFTHTGAGRMITQFNSYNYSRTKEIKNFVLKEAKQGNFAPMIFLLTAGGIVGSAIEGIRLLVTGKDVPEDLADWYIEALGQFGAYGYMSNIYSVAEYGSVNMGVAHDDALKLANSINSAFTRKDHKFDYMAKFIVADILPIVNVPAKRIYYKMDKEEKKKKAADRITGKSFRGFEGMSGLKGF